MFRPTEDFWEKALKALNKKEKINVDCNNTTKLNILQNIFTVIKKKQRMCLTKRWIYRKDSKKIIIRDQLEKIVKWMNKFKQIDDQVV